MGKRGFAMKYIKLLRSVVSESTISTDNDKIPAMEDIPEPKNAMQLWIFLRFDGLLFAQPSADMTKLKVTFFQVNGYTLIVPPKEVRESIIDAAQLVGRCCNSSGKKRKYVDKPIIYFT